MTSCACHRPITDPTTWSTITSINNHTTWAKLIPLQLCPHLTPLIMCTTKTTASTTNRSHILQDFTHLVKDLPLLITNSPHTPQPMGSITPQQEEA